MASRFFSFVLALSLSKGCLFVFCTSALFAQETVNLVPNPSFEEFENGCPVNYQDLPLHWSSWRETPDCFSTCGAPQNLTDSIGWAPWTGMGNQFPADGESFSGLYAHGWPAHPINKNYREYLGVEMIDPLEVGSTYYVSFKVSMGYYGNYFWFWWASSHLGMIFTTESFDSDVNPMPIPNFAHVYTNEVISDTTNWVTIQGSFVADLPYTHLALGVFFEYDQIQSVDMAPPNPPGNGLGSYYFVDDVCVSAYPDCVYVGVEDSPFGQASSLVYPNPANSFFRIDSKRSIERVVVYNLNGQIVPISSLASQNAVWDISGLTSGVYIAEITTNDKKTNRERLVIVR